MSDVCLDCMVCKGYETYKGKKCGFCRGAGMFEISQDSLQEWLDMAQEYRDFIEAGGDPEKWDR